jgi:hypothetical protein
MLGLIRPTHPSGIDLGYGELMEPARMFAPAKRGFRLPWYGMAVYGSQGRYPQPTAACGVVVENEVFEQLRGVGASKLARHGTQVIEVTRRGG